MEDLIYDQRSIPKEQWRYGFRTTAATGCGWIATYNALRLMNYKANPESLIYFMSGRCPSSTAILAPLLWARHNFSNSTVSMSRPVPEFPNLMTLPKIPTYACSFTTGGAVQNSVPIL